MTPGPHSPAPPPARPTGLAVVIMAHADPMHTRRLIGALDPLPVFLHLDASSDDAMLPAMIGAHGDRVVTLPRRKMAHGSWALVTAELDGLATALELTDAAHVAVLTGSDYPLASVPAIMAELAARPGTRVRNITLPDPGWSTRWHRDGGLWRLRYRYLTRGDLAIYLGPLALRWPGRRPLPVGVDPRGNAEWKIYARSDAEALLQTLSERGDLVRFWRKTLIPEETLVSSILGSTQVTGCDPLQLQQDDAWFSAWGEGFVHHPQYLDLSHLAAMDAERARRAESSARPLLFARKMRTGTSDLLVERLDATWRS